MSKNVKIALSLLISFILTSFIANNLYFKGTPKLNLFRISRLPKDISDQLTIFWTTFSYKISSNKVNYSRTFEAAPQMQFDPAPILSPTVFLSLTPTIVLPSATPTPEVITEDQIPKETGTVISPTKVPTKKPTAAPTKKPTSTSTTVSKISSPLSQPYYNPNLAAKCYNTAKFIEVYANSASSANCYSAVKQSVASNLTSVKIMGKSISVHKKAYPYFKAVADELERYKGSGGVYNFPSKSYRINSIGTYVFRCNVNSSSSSDLCSSGCKLSTHAFGIAVDINWETNANGSSKYDMPPEIVDAFESYGFRWGGRYKAIFGSTIDAMHFEFMYDLCKGIN